MDQMATQTDLIKDTDTPSFPKDVMEASQQVPVLVDFWAPWCGPCKQLGPAIEKAVLAQNGAIKLVKINVDENQALAGQMGVQSIPAVFAFAGGQPIDAFQGALPESEINKFIQNVLEKAGAPAGADSQLAEQIAQALEMANAAFDAGDYPRAAQLFQMVAQQAPDNADAIIGLAKVLMTQNQFEGVREVLSHLSEEQRTGEAFESIMKALTLAEEAEALGDASEFVARIEADPDDHQARIELATVLAAKGQKEEAAAALVDSFKRDRDWNDAAARKKLLEFFEAWGPKDPATLKGRRLLSSALFS